MKPFFKYNKNYLKHQSKYSSGWILKGSKTPVAQCGTNSLIYAIKYLFKSWVYAFKYPTTVSKTFLQVLLKKMFYNAQ